MPTSNIYHLLLLYKNYFFLIFNDIASRAMHNRKLHYLILCVFVILKIVAQYILIDPLYDLQRDEYLHLDQAQHLAWGYMSVPPFTSWMAWLIDCLGNNVFWVRFFPALFGGLTLAVVWAMIEALGGGLWATSLAAIALLFSVLLRLNMLFQPNSFDVLAWTSLYYCWVRYFQTWQAKWIYLAAACFTLGFLNKYNIVFLLMGFLPAVLLTPQRQCFFKKELYGASALALLLIMPNLYWQYQQHFPVFHHLALLAKTQLVHVDRLDFLKNQVFFFLGAWVWILLGLYALARYKAFAMARALGWSFCFTLGVFMYFKAKDYYAIGLYPIYIAFGVVYAENRLKVSVRRYVWLASVASILGFFIPLYQIGFPNRTPVYISQHRAKYEPWGVLRWEDGKNHDLPQDFADMLGWKSLAGAVDSVFSQLPHPDATLVLCDNYGQAGAINYYKRNPRLVAHTFNADYVHWFRLDKPIQDVILVREKHNNDRSEEKPLFDTVYLATQRINRFAREDTILIYVLKGAKININQRIAKEIKEEEW